MKETPQQYMQRIHAHVDGQKQSPLKVEAATPGKIARLIKGASAAKLRKRPAPGKWSVAEILAHLADTELVAGYRIRMILGRPGTPIQAFDQDEWAIAMNYAKRDARRALEEFRAMRETNLALLKSLRPEQWKHHGLHAERGEESVERIVRMFAGHDLNHLQQIERIVKSGKS
ncbi:MAG: DinB family protein [Candidatus Acidiferrales bacterium]